MNESGKKPMVFDNDRITRPYIGGRLLNEWRRMEPSEDGHQCEELLVTSIGAISPGKREGYGVSRTIPGQGGRLITDLIREDPAGILGDEYAGLSPGHLKVLARAGDTIVRLVLQCHPRREDGQKYFHSLSGKTEAWYIARTRKTEAEGPLVYAGFKKHVTKELWKGLCRDQDVPAMVNCLHKIPVKKDDVILIPAGMPHAVGPGCLFLELHECCDITIRVERHVNGVELTDEEMFHGLDFDRGMELFDYRTYTEEEIKNRVIMRPKNREEQEGGVLTWMIGPEDTNAFFMQVAQIKGRLFLPPFEGHRILVPVDGDIVIETEGEETRVTQGWGALLPAGCKSTVIRGEGAQVMIGLPSEGEEE